MAATNFAALTEEQLTVWSRTFWKEARNKTFVMSFAGTSANSMVQRITELSKTQDGARAVITLVNDAEGDGVVGDNSLEGNEEALRSTECVIQMDQWRHAHKSTGRMSEQRSVVKFRNEAQDKLSYRAANVMDQLAFLTLSGVQYDRNVDGTSRVMSQLPLLKYNNDVVAPSSKRYCRWDKANGLITSSASNADLVADDTPTWGMLVDLKAYAVNSYLRPIRTEDGVEIYNVFMTPDGIAKLKRDPDFLAAWQHAQKRGDSHPLFKGTPHGGKSGIYIDGLNIMEYRHVYHSDAWGGGTVKGQRVLLCGAQALAFADVGQPKWVEKLFDYDNVEGVSIAKIFGLLKPQLYSIHAKSKQDFGVICCDTAR